MTASGERTGDAVIVLSRIPGQREKLVGYNVEVDGRKVAKLEERETVRLPISVGPHRLRVEFGHGYSSYETLEAEPGGLHEYSCIAGGAAQPALADMLFRRHRYIVLVPADGRTLTPVEYHDRIGVRAVIGLLVFIGVIVADGVAHGPAIVAAVVAPLSFLLIVVLGHGSSAPRLD